MRKCDEAKGELYQEQEINFLSELAGRIDKRDPPARWENYRTLPKAINYAVENPSEHLNCLSPACCWRSRCQGNRLLRMRVIPSHWNAAERKRNARKFIPWLIE